MATRTEILIQGLTTHKSDEAKFLEKKMKLCSNYAVFVRGVHFRALTFEFNS